MKPLERIFFIACINAITPPALCMRDIVELFVGFGFPSKQLYYYVEKWTDKGFYDYGVNIGFGWFEIDKLSGEYKVLYEKYKKER